MTLWKCSIVLQIILNGLSRYNLDAPLNLSTPPGDGLHFNQNDARGCEPPMLKSALQRVCIKFGLFVR
jgi:hypothetical protein